MPEKNRDREHTRSEADAGEELIHSVDGGLDSGRGFGRIGETPLPRKAPKRRQAGASATSRTTSIRSR
jgi:hypothetical protein